MSFAPKIAVVVDNHSLLAIHTSDVEGNINAYLLDKELSDIEGRVAVYRLLLQGVEVDNVSIRRCTGKRWDPLDRMTGCLVSLVIYILHANDGVIVAAVLSVFQHNVSHDNFGERMTTSKIRRVIFVHRCTLGSRERAENEPITIKCAENEPITNECAENYQPITKEWSLGERGCAKKYFVDTMFEENMADIVVVCQKTARTMDVTMTCFYLYLGNVSALICSRVRYNITAQAQVFRCGLFQVDEYIAVRYERCVCACILHDPETSISLN